MSLIQTDLDAELKTNDNFAAQNLIFYLSLSRISFLSYEEKIFLSKNLDSADNLALLSIKELENLIQRKFSKRVEWNGVENLRMAKVALHYCEVLNIQIVPYNDGRYPALLLQTHNPPFVLFCRGNTLILNNRSISVVGTRRLSPEGKKAALEFSYAACMNGVNIISGLANGADGYAHKGAVDAFYDSKEKGFDTDKLGKTIAVLPSAIDEIVPYGHKTLAQQILQSGGCLISEYEPKMSMAKWHFVARNRIIAGMSPATLVVEAPAGSGALITADFALDFDREVVFHKATFGKLAEEISTVVKNQLDSDFANGLVSKYKRENTAEKFLEAGAPVVEDYEDFCAFLAEPPGKRSLNIKSEQGELFN